MRWIGVVVACLVLSGLPAAAEQMRTFKVGNWHAAAFRDQGTKRFSHCAGAVTYNSGVGVIFSVDRGYKWRVLFSAPHFNLEPGSTVKLGLSIDGDAPTTAVADAPNRQTVRIELAATAALFNRLRGAHQLRLFATDLSHTFNLTGTSRLLPALVDCVKNEGRPPVQVAAPPIQPVQIQAPPAPVSAPSSDHRAEATALVANLLSQAGVTGFQIAPAEDDKIGRVPEVVWASATLSGALFILQDRDIKRPSDTTPLLLAVDAKACKGKFASGSMPDEAHGTQARLFTACETDKASRTTFYLTTARPQGGFYVFATTADGADAPAKEADANIRAVVFKVVAK